MAEVPAAEPPDRDNQNDHGSSSRRRRKFKKNRQKNPNLPNHPLKAPYQDMNHMYTTFPETEDRMRFLPPHVNYQSTSLGQLQMPENL